MAREREGQRRLARQSRRKMPTTIRPSRERSRVPRSVSRRRWRRCARTRNSPGSAFASSTVLLVRVRTAHDIGSGARRALDQDFCIEVSTSRSRVGVPLDDLDETLEAFALDVLADLLVHARRVGTPPRRVDERERVIERDLLAHGQRLGEIGLALAREADDHVGRQGQPRHGAAQLVRERRNRHARCAASRAGSASSRRAECTSGRRGAPRCAAITSSRMSLGCGLV